MRSPRGTRRRRRRRARSSWRQSSALHAHAEQDLNRAAVSATTHCLTGCAIGEILGMVIATAAGWGNAASIAISIVLAFFFGYLLTLWPVLRAGLSLRQATGIALAADTLSITIMEAVDNGFVLVGFAIAFGPTWAANRWLIARGRGHAVAHEYHHGHH